MKIAIVDDNEMFLKKTKLILCQRYLDEDIDVFNSIGALETSKIDYDFLILDIEMPDEDGLSYAKRSIKKHPYIIFITSHNEFMEQAFDENVIGFIPKDKLEKLLITNAIKVEKKLASQKYVYFKTQQEEVCFKLRDILYFHYDGTTVNIQLENKKYITNFTSLSKLKYQEEINYLRINRNYIINLSKILRINTHTHIIYLQNGTEIKVSDRHWSEFIKSHHIWRNHND